MSNGATRSDRAGIVPAGQEQAFADEMEAAIAPLLPGFGVQVLGEVDSTNSELMRRARCGRLQPTLLVASRQTAGRGRLGRTWHSNAGGSLTFSLGLPLAPAEWAGLSLAVGVSLAETLHPAIRLKWPNDLWLHERKLAGILIETATGVGVGLSCRYVVIGVGINIAGAAPDSFATPAACLRELFPAADPAATLQAVAAPLVQAVKVFEASGFASFQARFDALDVLRGREVVLSDGTAGVARGTDRSGALMVHTASAVKTIISSEVSVRPAA